MTMNSAVEDLKGESYFSLESYKKNGRGVRTPLWFVEKDGLFYFFTDAGSWKVKRINNNPKVRFAKCDVRGKIKGDWYDAIASRLENHKVAEVNQMMRKKYPLKRVMDFFNKIRRPEHAVFEVKPA